MKRLLLVFAALVLVAGCSKALKDQGTPIRELQKRDAPAPEDLKIEASAPVEANPELALENYRKILELTPDAETRAEAARRLADLQIQVDELDPSSDNERAIRESIQLYQKLLKDRPNDPHNDRVLYQLARAYQNIGDSDRSVEVLKRLSEAFPNSPYTADGRFRRAELLFRMDRYREASEEYAFVMDLKEQTPFFEAAQYKYGWSLYKQSRYDEALEVFFSILDRELPAEVPPDPEAAIQGVAKGKGDLTKDVLRVTSLSFASMGGGEAVNEVMQRRGEPRYFPLLYAALGESLLDKQRYTDAAKAYAAFIERHPNHPLAPQFQTRVIAATRDGGFPELVIAEKQRYAETYDPRAPYWNGAAPTPEVLAELRTHLEDLAKYFHAQAIDAKKAGTAKPEAFLTAAGWYKRIIEVYPKDPKIADINFLYADTLLDGQRTLEAAEQYTATAYNYQPYRRAAEAAYAAVLAYQKHAAAVPAEQRPAALRLAIDSSLRMADRFPGHPQVMPVLTRAAEDLFEIKAYDEAIQVAARVLAAEPPARADLRRTAWSVTADAQFTLGRYPDAEQAYAALQPLLAQGNAEERGRVSEQLAASVYKQAEAAREGGDLRGAVEQFLRVGKVAPNASVRAKAEYDAAAALLKLEDWLAAAQVLEGFRSRYPRDELVPDADKNLALAYERADRPTLAAAAYARVAERQTESAEVRREAALKAAKLYDQAGDALAAAKAYEFYVGAFPSPLDVAMESRDRLSEIYKAKGDTTRYRFWLNEIVNADAAAGAQRSEATRLLAARASLELGRAAARDAQAAKLTLPLDKSVPARKAATERAVSLLSRAAEFGFAEVTTAATYELGVLYREFSRDLVQSARPPGLDDLAREQYELLLEEQAYPFEEKAIAFHETNLKRIAQGVYDPWVKKSYDALVDIAPGQYGKREQTEDYYDALR